MMRRRTFITSTVTVLAAPLAAEAQPQPGRVYRIGVLGGLSREQTSSLNRAFEDGLRELGYSEGHNVMIEYRFADGQSERLAELARELVHSKVDLIFAPTTRAAQAAKAVAQTLPIVFCTAADPVGDGLALGFARPGWNATGLTTSSSELSAKRLELLRDVVPRITRVGTIRYPGYAQATRAQESTEDAARQLRLQLLGLEARESDYNTVLSAMAAERVGAVVLLPHPSYFRDRKRIAELAVKHRIPSIYEYAEYPAAGGLMSYGPNLPDLFRRAATYVDKILKGAKPADLPVEQPTKFDLVINLKTAKALGLTIPRAVLARADEIIE